MASRTSIAKGVKVHMIIFKHAGHYLVFEILVAENASFELEETFALMNLDHDALEYEIFKPASCQTCFNAPPAPVHHCDERYLRQRQV